MEYTYEIIDNFFTKDNVVELLDMVVTNSGPDSKPFFEGTALLDSRTLDENAYPTNIDPNMLLLKIKDKIESYYLEKYKMLGTLVFSRMFGASMFEGAELAPHRDEDPNPDGEYDGKKRSHVCSIILNDDFEGGELVFQDQEKTVKGKAGDMILFPGYYVSHGVAKITKGTRRVLLVFFYDVIKD